MAHWADNGYAGARAEGGQARAALPGLPTAREASRRVHSDPSRVAMPVAIARGGTRLRAAEACAAREPLFDMERPLRGDSYISLALPRDFRAFGGVAALSDRGSFSVRDGVPKGVFERASFAGVRQRFVEALRH